jgi:integrase
MALLAECPRCHKKQAVKNRQCACGEDLVKAKRGQRVRYWVNYRLPNGKQRREAAGYSIEEARAAEGKRKAQKVENPGILERVPAERMTFNELADWYLDLSMVKKLASFNRVKIGLAKFNQVLGDRIVGNLKPLDLEEYQAKRKEEGRAAATIDMEISLVKTMVTKAFDNDMVAGSTVKIFRKVKRQLKRGSNARRQTLRVADYLRLLQVAPPHLKTMLILAYNTGMRLGELRALQWKHIDRKTGFIRLPAGLTKEGKAKVIPINHHVIDALDQLPLSIHGFVITYQGQPITSEGGCKKAFKTACERAIINRGRDVEGGLIFHDIRRTVKTSMVNAGIDQVHRDLILGHSLNGMDIFYMAPAEDDLAAAMARYTHWLDDQIANVDQTVDQVIRKPSAPVAQ